MSLKPINCNTISYSIRPARLEDLDAMREICVETSSMPLRDSKDRRFLLLTYCDSYVEYTSDCFVAVGSDGRLLGYILCAPDTREFFKKFRKEALGEIKKLGFKYSFMSRGICAQQIICSPFAGAHLHIDLTASARRQGIGTELINTLKKHLADKGVRRVQLTCGSNNKSAIAFYKRNGFKTVIRGFGACVMRADVL